MEDINDSMAVELEIGRRMYNFWLRSLVPEPGFIREPTPDGWMMVGRRIGELTVSHELVIGVREGVVINDKGISKLALIDDPYLYMGSRKPDNTIADPLGARISEDLDEVLWIGPVVVVDMLGSTVDEDKIQRGDDCLPFLPLLLSGLVEHHDDVTDQPPKDRLRLAVRTIREQRDGNY